MLIKNNFSLNSKKFSKNLNATQKIFKTFKIDYNNHKIPLLQSFEKSYEFSFSKATIKKFSNCRNVIIIGMGGSILGTKSIYSFFRSKIKKNFFFFDNLDSNLHLKYKKLKNKKDSCFIVV